MNYFIKITSIAVIIGGILCVVGGLYGIFFIYKNVSQEKIVTPEDAAISKKLVSGPLTLKAQADIIRKHTLRMTGGKTYSEMPQYIEQTDQNGKTIQVKNTARDIWITATALTTALNLGIFAYAFSVLVSVFGMVFIWIGMIFYFLSSRI